MRKLFLTMLLLAGCVTVDPANYAQTNSRVTAEHDRYQGSTSYRAPPVSWTNNLFNFGSYFLRATRSDANSEWPEMVQIYVEANIFGRWAFLDTAHAVGGERINVTQINRDVSCTNSLGCNHYETVGLNLTPDQFRRFAETGLDVQISGRGGRVNFQVPATYFRAFGDAVGVPQTVASASPSTITSAAVALPVAPAPTQAPEPSAASAFEPNTARPGGTYTTLVRADAAACAQACSGDSLCMSWTFTANACELKAIVPMTVAQPGAVSGVPQRTVRMARVR